LETVFLELLEIAAKYGNIFRQVHIKNRSQYSFAVIALSFSVGRKD